MNSNEIKNNNEIKTSNEGFSTDLNSYFVDFKIKTFEEYLQPQENNVLSDDQKEDLTKANTENLLADKSKEAIVHKVERDSTKIIAYQNDIVDNFLSGKAERKIDVKPLQTIISTVPNFEKEEQLAKAKQKQIAKQKEISEEPYAPNEIELELIRTEILREERQDAKTIIGITVVLSILSVVLLQSIFAVIAIPVILRLCKSEPISNDEILKKYYFNIGEVIEHEPDYTTSEARCCLKIRLHNGKIIPKSVLLDRGKYFEKRTEVVLATKASDGSSIIIPKQNIK